MASRIKIVLLMLVSCGAMWAGISAIDLPGPVIYDKAFVKPSAELKRMQTEVAAVATTLRRVTVADSVQKLLAATNAPIVAVYDTNPRISAALATQMRKHDDRRARIALLMMPVRYGALTPAGASNPPNAEFMFGGTTDSPWCAAVHYHTSDWTLPAGDENRLLGPCTFWAKYGPPGPAIQAWLVRGGYGFADATESLVLDDETEVRPRRRVFGLRQGWYGEPLVGERCLSGRKGACAEAVMDSGAYRWGWWRGRVSLPDAPPAYVRENYAPITFGYLDGAMLAGLEQRHGREAFTKFWQSRQPVESAFQAAFGLSLDDYVREWGRDVYGSEPIGPRMSLVTVLLSLLTVGGLVGVGLRIVQRREVR
jgi:hypothetical protein